MVNKREKENKVGIGVCGLKSTKVFDGNYDRVASTATFKKYSFSRESG